MVPSPAGSLLCQKLNQNQNEQQRSCRRRAFKRLHPTCSQRLFSALGDTCRSHPEVGHGRWGWETQVEKGSIRFQPQSSVWKLPWDVASLSIILTTASDHSAWGPHLSQELLQRSHLRCEEEKCCKQCNYCVKTKQNSKPQDCILTCKP